MSGHSKWSQIKRQKGVADSRRGQVFTKLVREITLAARHGGVNPDSNFRLRLAIQKAKDSSMPVENIDRALKRVAGGEDSAVQLVESTYEAYGPGGTAILMEVVTDNKNRTISEIRSVFTRHGANLGAGGSVSWLFEHMGVITLEAKGKSSDDIALYAIDAGAEDVKVEDSIIEVYTKPENLETVRKGIAEKGIEVSSAELSMVPKTTIALDPRTAEQALRLLDRLEELEDIQRVYTNADFPQEALEHYRSAG